MSDSLTIGNTIFIFGVMLVLAFIPGVSVLTVSARSAVFGFKHGLFTTIGIISGDLFFILIAVLGLSLLVDAMENQFEFIKYLGALYLIILGVLLWKSPIKRIDAVEQINSSLFSSFLTGLLITLADQKAILFYLSFFPAFIDLSKISFWDTTIIISVAALAISIAKLSYAYMAVKSALLISSSKSQWLNMLAGSIMVGVGLLIIYKA